MTTAAEQRSRLSVLARALAAAGMRAALSLFHPRPPTVPSSLSAQLTIETMEAATLWLLWLPRPPSRSLCSSPHDK